MGEGKAASAREPVGWEDLRRTGISAIGDVPWGTHLYQFYEDRQDLIDVLVPYFKAGLENNELCLWVTSEPVRSTEAKSALATTISNLEDYIASGQLEILDSDWYTSAKFESGRVLQGWVDRLHGAERRRLAGLRWAGNPSWLERPECHDFIENGASVDTIFGPRRILAICSYHLSKCDAAQIIEVINNHPFGLVKRAGKWELISHHDSVIQKNRLTAIFEALPAGVALIDVRGGKLQSNLAFEQVWAGPAGATRFENYPARKAWWVDTGKPVQPYEWASARAVQKGETVVNQEIEIERLDGSRGFVLNSAAPIRDVHGRISGSAVAITDITRLKQAEEALRESESRFRALVMATSDVVYRMSPDWKMMLSLRGRDFIADTEEPSGSWLQKYIHPDDQPYVMAAIDEAISTKSTFELEHRVLRVDGSLGWTFSRAVPIQNAAGDIIEWFGAATDITERKRVEEELRRNQAQLMHSQHLANVGSWERDVATGRVRWSDQMYGIYGLPDDTQPVLQTFLSRVHPKDQQIISEAQKKALAADTPIVVEYRITRPDGEVRFIRSIAEVVKNDQSTPLRFDGTDLDITEQVRARELLHESKARLENAERLANLGHWDWDLKTNDVLLSEGAYRILDKPRDYRPSFEDLVRMTISEDKQRVDQVVRGALAQNRGFAIEFQITRPNGDRRTLRAISDGPLNDDEGKRSRMFGTLQDITEEKRAQVETCARQKVETVVTLAGGIAHDFNNLLGSALAQAELGLGELEAGFSPKDELQAIRDVAIRGSEIVRQLMVYTGKESAAVEPLNVSTVIKEMLQLLKVSVSKHAVIEVMLDEDLPTVWANAPQLRQIVMNLVINASEAIGDGDGVIRVSTNRETADANSSDAIREPLGAHPYVRLSVSDTGHGMSPEIQSKVFDPFFTTKSTGHGVGLATTHGIVRSLGGTIRLMSEPGKGTTFHIMLPCNETQPQSTQRSRALVQQPARQAPATVLVVEDEDSLRQAVSKLLVRNGFEVIEAADGSSAIAILHANQDRLDAILLDATLPGVSSKEIVAEVATIRPDTKVILTSAYSQEMLLTGINGQQIHGFVRKPYQLGDLMKTLSDVLCV